MTPRLRQTVEYFLALAFGQGLSFLILPIVTRFLGPVEYGEYALALTVTSLVGMFASGWVRNVGLRLYYDANSREGTKSFYLGTALLQGVLAIALLAVATLALQYFGAEVAPPRVMLAAGIALIAGDQYGYAITLLRAEERSTAFAIGEIASGALRFSATLVGLLVGFRSAELLFYAMALAYGIGTLYAVFVLWPLLTGRIGVDKDGVLETVRLGPASLPFSVAGWVDQLSDRLIVLHFLGTAAVGIYSVGYSIGERLIGSLTQAIFMMAWPNILNAWSSGGVNAARDALTEAQRLFYWLSIGPLLFLIVFGNTLTRYLAGPEFALGGAVVPLIASAMWVRAFSGYLNRHLELNKRFGRISSIAMIGAALNVALNFALIPRFGLVGAAASSLASQITVAGIYLLIRDRTLTKLNRPALLMSSIIAISVWLATSLLFRTIGISVQSIWSMGFFVLAYAAVVVAAFIRRAPT